MEMFEENLALYRKALQLVSSKELDELDPKLHKLIKRMTQKRFDYSSRIPQEFTDGKWDKHRYPQVRTISFLSKVLFEPTKRDILLKIGRHYAPFTVFTELATLDSYEHLKRTMTPALQKEFYHCFQTTYRTRLITQMDVQQGTDGSV